jgi:hypothetical protein
VALIKKNHKRNYANVVISKVFTLVDKLIEVSHSLPRMISSMLKQVLNFVEALVPPGNLEQQIIGANFITEMQLQFYWQTLAAFTACSKPPDHDVLSSRPSSLFPFRSSSRGTSGFSEAATPRRRQSSPNSPRPP